MISPPDQIRLNPVRANRLRRKASVTMGAFALVLFLVSYSSQRTGLVLPLLRHEKEDMQSSLDLKTLRAYQLQIFRDLARGDNRLEKIVSDYSAQILKYG